MNTPIADDFPAIAAGMGEGSGMSDFEMAPLTILECSLTDLETASRLLGHLSTSDLGSELNAVAAMVDKAHAGILASYERARALFKAQREAHLAELGKAQEAKAAPGSRQDVERAVTMWRLLRVIANAAIERCDEAEGITAGGNANG